MDRADMLKSVCFLLLNRNSLDCMEQAAGPLSNLKAVKQESQMKSVFNEEKLQNQSENHNQH